MRDKSTWFAYLAYAKPNKVMTVMPSIDTVVNGVMPLGITIVEETTHGADFFASDSTLTSEAIQSWCRSHGFVRDGAYEMGYHIPAVKLYNNGKLIIRLRSI